MVLFKLDIKRRQMGVIVIMNFSYSISDGQVKIKRFYGEEESIAVPCSLNGQAVAEIGAYAFQDCRKLREIQLPDTIIRIGSHAFYNCVGLAGLVLADGVTNIEDGAFKNCRNLKYITINSYKSSLYCMKSILSELSGELHFKVIEKHAAEEVYKLVFPRYLYDYEENTEARIINQVTYGSGVHYRDCINDREIDYRAYDEAFCTAVIRDTRDTALDIAMFRLLYPKGLSDISRRRYCAYLEDNLLLIIKEYLRKENWTGLRELEKLGMYKPKDMDSILRAVQETGNLAGISYFMNYRCESLSGIHKEYDL